MLRHRSLPAVWPCSSRSARLTHAGLRRHRRQGGVQRRARVSLNHKHLGEDVCPGRSQPSARHGHPAAGRFCVFLRWVGRGGWCHDGHARAGHGALGVAPAGCRRAARARPRCIRLACEKPRVLPGRLRGHLHTGHHQGSDRSRGGRGRQQCGRHAPSRPHTSRRGSACCREHAGTASPLRVGARSNALCAGTSPANQARIGHGPVSRAARARRVLSPQRRAGEAGAGDTRTQGAAGAGCQPSRRC
mmetsp:Transcript_10739/g.27161  ORF Transcript_10739/g.27161 Transcript_10739/m.27161 type:complete len:246 (+) Transcript_10739:515-1252(+)